MADDESPPPAKRMRYMLSDTTMAEEAQKTELTELNTDCLLKVFDYLKLLDLYTMSETNLEMKSVALLHFRLKYKRFNFYPLIEHGPIQIDVIKRLLSTFGHLIVSMNVSRGIFDAHQSVPIALLVSIGHYCHTNLKALILEEFDLGPKAIFGTHHLFRYLEKLELIDCNFNEMFWLVVEDLKSLKLIRSDCNWENVRKNSLSFNTLNLEEAQFDKVKIPTATMYRFLFESPFLQRLSIVNCDVSSRICRAIGQLVHLKELEFQRYQRQNMQQIFQDDIKELASLKQLKVLKLDCNRSSVLRLFDEFIANGCDIEHLELAQGLIDDCTVQSICKLSSIKVLKLNEMTGLDESHVVQMVQELQLLQALHIKTRKRFLKYDFNKMIKAADRLSILKIDIPNFTVNSYIYTAMLNAIQKRPEHKYLEFTIYGGGFGHILISKETLASNEKWLRVNELDRSHNHLFPQYASHFDSDEENEDDDEDEAFLMSDDEQDVDLDSD